MFIFCNRCSKLIISLFILLSISFIGIEINLAKADPVPFEVQGSCTTSGTSKSGERKGCSESLSYTAPSNRYIIEDSVKVRETDARGSENACDRLTFQQTVIKKPFSVPTSVSIRIKARSKGGISNAGKRGRIGCGVTGSTEVIPNFF